MSEYWYERPLRHFPGNRERKVDWKSEVISAQFFKKLSQNFGKGDFHIKTSSSSLLRTFGIKEKRHRVTITEEVISQFSIY